MEESHAAARPVALVIAYDGTSFAGWQEQPGHETVQGTLKRALAEIHGVPADELKTVGAGRTDAGVHALGQVASYRPPTERPVRVVERALTGLLPPTIRVLRAREMPHEFHALGAAEGKLYRYRIVQRATILPFESRWSWHVPRRLDVGAMREAAARLRGRRDFAPLSATGSTASTTVRDLRRLDVVRREDGVVEIDALADGFLYKMVRILTGLLVEIGAGRRAPDDVGLDRRRGASPRPIRTAPPQGLCLVRVDYPERLGEL